MPADMNDYFNKKNAQQNNQGSQYQPPEFLKDFGKKAGFLYVIIILGIIIFLAKPFIIINSGEVGIKVTAGKFESIPLEPGFHLYLPVIQKIIVVDTKVRIINYRGAERLDTNVAIKNDGITSNESISVLDSRGLPVSIDLTVQYRLLPFGAPQTIATWGLSWENKIINPVVRDVVRSVIGSVSAEELPVKRNQIATLIENDIRSKVSKLENQPVELLSIQLREIVLPTKIKEQIERVQIAKQEAQRTEYEVERAKQEALKKAALAEGEAEANRIRSKGIADAIMIEATSQAEANKKISDSLSKDLLHLRQIEVQGKFNEALRENTDAKIFLTPGGAVPNIWVDSKDVPSSKPQKQTSIENQ
ncbi:MAG: prohibitin family protein [Campylobacterales bacterium]|nr:prohibitin family protein [Campylobacterales bacterium]